MNSRWAGPLVTALILGGVAAIVLLNLDLKGTPPSPPTNPAPTPAPKAEAPAPTPGGGKPVGFREYPIGEPVVQSHMKIAAVWLPPIQMDGMDSANSDVIHLEADIHATAENPNGFALDEFVPYLKVDYAITPASGGPPIHQGTLTPMVARDGLHYGASIAMPKKGSYRLTYDLSPPSAGGLGRHSDPATGVAPWWKPFQVRFDWDYPGPPGKD